MAGGLHIIQAAQDITDPVSGVLHLCFRLLDAVKHHPVDKQAVKKVIRKAQETIHLCLYIRVDGHVAQLGAEAAELDLQCFDLVLCAVQMAVLGKVGNQPAAEQIERTPAAGTVQARKNAVRRAAGGEAGLDRLPDLALLRLLAGNLLLQLQDAFSLRVSLLFQRLTLGRERLLVLLFAVPERVQLAFIPGNVLPYRFQFTHHAVVLGRSGMRFLLFFVELCVFAAKYSVEQCGEAAPLQPVHILLLGGAHGFEFTLVRLQVTAAGAQ